MTARADTQSQSASLALGKHLRRVVKEQSRARKKLAPGPVHDLRVALRRGRSLAEGLGDLDTHPGWKNLRKSGKRLLGGLRELRDAQMMLEWARKLRLTEGSAGEQVAAALRKDERRARREARTTLEEFRRKRWKHWSKRLPKRARRLPAGEAHFAAVALERLASIRELDRQARKRSDPAACHRARIALKRFRYVVDGFLPEQRRLWGRDLKRMQNALGEVHDLDVLRARLRQMAREESLSRMHMERWLARIERARAVRIARYEAIVVGNQTARRRTGGSLWDRWQSVLETLAGSIRQGVGSPSR